jgi:hypothetical protein
LPKKTGIRAEKGQREKVNLGWHKDRKENPISAPSIHVSALGGWVLVHSGSIYYIIYTIVISTEIQVVSPTVMNIDATHLMQHVFPSELA